MVIDLQIPLRLKAGFEITQVDVSTGRSFRSDLQVLQGAVFSAPKQITVR